MSYILKNMKTPTLHLLMGLPGSGKTTLAKQLQRMSGAVRLSSDDFRLLLFPEPTFSQKEHDILYKILDYNVKHLLDAGYDVIYDANLNRRIHRDEKYDLAKAHNAKTILWWVVTNPELAKQRRLNDQNHVLIPAGETPEKLFDRVAGVIETPETDELPIQIDGMHIKEQHIKSLLENKEP